MSKPRPSSLKRPLNKMPDFVRDALLEHRLMKAYDRRPPYQRNDYLGWITRAKRQETKEKRLMQMLSELEDGTKYMKIDWHPRRAPDSKGLRDP